MILLRILEKVSYETMPSSQNPSNKTHILSLTPIFSLFVFSDVFCCGPVPLKAIKEGQLNVKYDAPFVFAEVNADVKTFMKRPDGTTEEVISSAFVGQRISTKSVGSDQREDITHLYKYPEGKRGLPLPSNAFSVNLKHTHAHIHLCHL